MHDYHWFGMGYGWIIAFVCLVIIVWIIVTISLRISNRKESGKSAMDTLKERYAKGEISKEEFERIKKDLMQ